MQPKLIIWALVLAVLATSGPVSSIAAKETGCIFACPEDGPKYTGALLTAIQEADRIVVTEHSSPWDAYDVQANRSRIDTEIEYARVELTAEQRHRFSEILAKLDTKTQDWANGCMPEIHHTVRFYGKGAVASTMEICFTCDHVFWDAMEKVSPPGSIYDGLRKFVAAIGLHPKRDWTALADHRIAAQKQ